MNIGVPKETRAQENRVAVTPGAVRSLVAAGHSVTVQSGAGSGSSFTDGDYAEAGAVIAAGAAEAWAQELVLKVKEPTPDEYGFLRPDLTLFAYLHLAADRALTEKLLEAGTAALAYETVQLADGSLPLLAPMSEVAGRMAVQVGAGLLSKPAGGRGVLLGGVPGVGPGHVVVLGAGMVGTNAVKMAVGIGARVTVIDISHTRLQYLADVFGSRIESLMSNTANIEASVRSADLVIGAVLIPGARTPQLVSRELVTEMQPGSAVVDVAVDQGGCIATIRPTTHSEPTYLVDGVVHYGVSNMPGAVPYTSTQALSGLTLPWILQLAAGRDAALRASAPLRLGLNTYGGHLTNAAVAGAFGLPASGTDELLRG